MSAYSPVTDPELVDYVHAVKYPAARAAIKVLKNAGLRVLHVGSPAFDPWRPPGTYSFDDLDLLIRDSDLAAFRQAMESAGYRFILDDPHTQTSSEAPPELVEKLLSRPNDPHIGYAPEIKFHADIWVTFGTTWRHGVLQLVDLEEWFSAGESDTVVVMGDTQIERPPIWGLVLWQAAEITNAASDNSATTHEVEELHRTATRPEVDWDRVLDRAKAYDQEYLARRRRAEGILRAHAQQCGMDPALLVGPEAPLAYGPLYEVRYGLEALEDFYPGTVPTSVLEGVKSGTGRRPRKMWGYADPDYADRYCLDGSAGRVGYAPFGIRTQIEEYGELGGLEFFTQGIVPVVAQAPPAGPWEDCTEETLRMIFAPL